MYILTTMRDRQFWKSVSTRILNAIEYMLGHVRIFPLTIVTGANFTHGESLVQLVKSILQHEPKARIFIYDLGLSPDQRTEIEQIMPHATIRTFQYDQYPDWFNIRLEAGQYAWKPVIVYEVMRESPGPLVWLDAGDILVGKINQVYARVCRSGFYSLTSDGDLEKWTHELTLTYFHVDRQWARGKLNVASGCCAFNPMHRAAVALAKDWSRYAKIRSAIAPVGSSRLNHRQDQALLGV